MQELTGVQCSQNIHKFRSCLTKLTMNIFKKIQLRQRSEHARSINLVLKLEDGYTVTILKKLDSAFMITYLYQMLQYLTK